MILLLNELTRILCCRYLRILDGCKFLIFFYIPFLIVLNIVLFFIASEQQGVVFSEPELSRSFFEAVLGNLKSPLYICIVFSSLA